MFGSGGLQTLRAFHSVDNVGAGELVSQFCCLLALRVYTQYACCFAPRAELCVVVCEFGYVRSPRCALRWWGLMCAARFHVIYSRYTAPRLLVFVPPTRAFAELVKRLCVSLDFSHRCAPRRVQDYGEIGRLASHTWKSQ